jgi:hypothetical protein
VEACGKCDSCLLFDAPDEAGVIGNGGGGTHPDYHRVYRQLVRLQKDSVARDLSVDVIRDFLVVPASHSSQLGLGKVFVVEEAETMNTQAQNALLKTLEEPAGNTLIVLLTSQSGALLPTIRSRCQPQFFGPIPERVVVEQLVKRGAGEEDARDAARLGEGSLGVAIRLWKDGLLPSIRELEQRITATLSGKGAAGGDDLPKFLKQFGETLAEKTLERDPAGSKDQATREALVLVMKLAADHCRRFLRKARTRTGMNRLCTAIDHLTQAQNNIESNAAISLSLQAISAQLEG